MLTALLLLGIRLAPPTDIGLENLPISKVSSAISALPPGTGEYLHFRVFDGAAEFLEPDSAAVRMQAVVAAVNLAHSHGYRVAGVIDFFWWTAISKSPQGASLVDFQNTNAFAHKPLSDFVCPFAPTVKAVLLHFADLLCEAKLPLDVGVMRFTSTRDPALAFGVETRRQYIKETSTDPVDILDPLDSKDTQAARFFTWRLAKVNAVSEEVIGAIRKGLGHTPVYLRADPDWAFRSPQVRGAELNDWPLALGKGLIDGLIVRTGGAGDKENRAIDDFVSTLSALKRPTSVWLEGKASDQPYFDSITPVLKSAGNKVRNYVREDR